MITVIGLGLYKDDLSFRAEKVSEKKAKKTFTSKTAKKRRRTIFLKKTEYPQNLSTTHTTRQKIFFRT
ncbi:MAG: hypothetical protein L6V85_05230 [Clostridiales bacterium]|nr:MAG: hypothetical protein L6V85_05230 [Clostridiales bacterium]